MRVERSGANIAYYRPGLRTSFQTCYPITEIFAQWWHLQAGFDLAEALSLPVVVTAPLPLSLALGMINSHQAYNMPNHVPLENPMHVHSEHAGSLQVSCIWESFNYERQP
jgi:hypothetical protein